ncbi:MAG: hypothetical protein NTU53_06120 [Planctomycetota bacterium]|nr:hypothetical protein [Planctomycetota bacterium]
MLHYCCERQYASADGVMVPATTAAEKQKRRQTVLKQRRERSGQRGKRRGHLPAVNAGADQRYKRFYLTAFYDQYRKHWLVSVTRKDHKGLGKLLRRDAAKLRLRAADERVGRVDGAAVKRAGDAMGQPPCGRDDGIGGVARKQVVGPILDQRLVATQLRPFRIIWRTPRCWVFARVLHLPALPVRFARN